MMRDMPDPAPRAALCAGALIAALVLAFFSIRNALAYHASQLETRAGYERAVRLEPGNAHYWYLLGRYWQYSIEESDQNKAVKDYLTALSLDPHSSDAWLDLATAYEGEGDTSEARSAFLAAKHVYPASAEVSWRYGNFLLRQGERAAAYQEIHSAVEADPKLAPEAFSRCWRAAPDLNAILDKVLPATKENYLGAIRELVAAGQLDPALEVWTRVVALHPTMSPKEILSFTNSLLQHGRAQELKQVWEQAVSLMKNPPHDPAGSILWDGSFESGMIGDGLAWQFPPVQNGVRAALDTGQAHSGKQSLRLMFTADDNIEYSDACHYVIAEPGKSYRFSAWVRTEALTTAEGVRFQIRSFGPQGARVTETADVHGSEPWTNINLDWTAPQEEPIAQVCIARKISGDPEGDIQGTAWIDDVSLVPVSSKEHTP